MKNSHIRVLTFLVIVSTIAIIILHNHFFVMRDYIKIDTSGAGQVNICRDLVAETDLSVSGVLSTNTIADVESEIKANASTISANDALVAHLAGPETFTGPKTFNDVVHVLTPSESTHAVDKKYVDGLMQGVDLLLRKEACRVKTVIALPSHTAVAGVLTSTVTTALIDQDGITLVLGDRVLVNADGASNGIYTVTAVGSGSEAWELTRAEDALVITSGMIVFVREGDTCHDTLWAVSTDVAIVMETTPIAFVLIGTENAEHVDLTENQSIGGIKTFTGSVIVPALSAGSSDTYAADKKYVDDQVAAGGGGGGGLPHSGGLFLEGPIGLVGFGASQLVSGCTIATTPSTIGDVYHIVVTIIYTIATAAFGDLSGTFQLGYGGVLSSLDYVDVESSETGLKESATIQAYRTIGATNEVITLHNTSGFGTDYTVRNVGITFTQVA